MSALGRYSPGECVGAVRLVALRVAPILLRISAPQLRGEGQRPFNADGNAAGSRGSTNVFVSKKAENHAQRRCYLLHALQLRSHPSDPSPCTPAMAAGVTPKLWELADMVKVLEDWEAIT